MTSINSFSKANLKPTLVFKLIPWYVMILKSILSIYKQKFMSLITFVIKYFCMKLHFSSTSNVQGQYHSTGRVLAKNGSSWISLTKNILLVSISLFDLDTPETVLCWCVTWCQVNKKYIAPAEGGMQALTRVPPPPMSPPPLMNIPPAAAEEQRAPARCRHLCPGRPVTAHRGFLLMS